MLLKSEADLVDLEGKNDENGQKVEYLKPSGILVPVDPDPWELETIPHSPQPCFYIFLYPRPMWTEGICGPFRTKEKYSFHTFQTKSGNYE